MLTLAERVRAIRGKRNFVKFAAATGVNRQTLKDIEDGKSVQMETLKRIAASCSVDPATWDAWLIAWVHLQLGQDEFRKLDIRPALDGPDYYTPKPVFRAMLEQLFRELNGREQA